ncbi:hypothetical protein [Microvirga sp. P5_D2]
MSNGHRRRYLDLLALRESSLINNLVHAHEGEPLDAPVNGAEIPLDMWSVANGPSLIGNSYQEILVLEVSSVSPDHRWARLRDGRVALLRRRSPLPLHPEARV